MVNFHYALSLAHQLFDIEGNEDDLEEIGLIAYNHIGNKNTRLYRAILDVNCEDGSVELPCNADIIEAVTYCCLEDWNYTSNKHNYGDPQSYYTEHYVEGLKVFTDPFYINGKYVDYKRVGNKLYINKGLDKVQILYQGILLDEDGLPELTDKEALAIAEYIAYTLKFKEAIKTNDKNTFAISENLKLRWLFHCDAARVPEYVSLEEMNKILDASSSWGRKVYNKSYKPVM